jgi:hypothetical protein
MEHRIGPDRQRVPRPNDVAAPGRKIARQPATPGRRADPAAGRHWESHVRHIQTIRKEATLMMPADALILALADASPFAPPPNRPSRSNRRPAGGVGTARALLEGLRGRLDAAVRVPVGPWIPRITSNYPY